MKSKKSRAPDNIDTENINPNIMINIENQKTARTENKNILMPNLNLNQLNSNKNSGLRRSGSTHYTTRDNNLKSNIVENILPNINSKRKNYDLPLQITSNLNSNQLSSIKEKSDNDIRQIKFNQIKFAAKNRRFLPKLNLNIKNIIDNHKSECPTFRNLKANSEIDANNKSQKDVITKIKQTLNLNKSEKAMLRSQSLKESIQFKSKNLYNSEICRFNKAKERSKSYMLNFNRKSTARLKAKGLLNLENMIKHNLKNIESRNEQEKKYSKNDIQQNMKLIDFKQNMQNKVSETLNLFNNK